MCTCIGLRAKGLGLRVEWILRILHEPKYLYLGDYGAFVC